MGTSADRSAGRGGAWTSLKIATNSYVREIGGKNSTERAMRVLSRHLPILGGAAGATGAAASGRSGTVGIQRLGALLTGIGSTGLDGTLASLGLGTLAGRDRFTVLDELITYIAGNGDDLDAQAARDAACDVLDEIFREAEEWDEMANVVVGRGEVVSILERFLALYIYNRVPVVAERLSRLTDPTAMRHADQEMRQIIGDIVAIHLPEDAFTIDWQGEQGQEVARNAMESTYAALEALEQRDES